MFVLITMNTDTVIAKKRFYVLESAQMHGFLVEWCGGNRVNLVCDIFNTQTQTHYDYKA